MRLVKACLYILAVLVLVRLTWHLSAEQARKDACFRCATFGKGK